MYCGGVFSDVFCFLFVLCDLKSCCKIDIVIFTRQLKCSTTPYSIYIYIYIMSQNYQHHKKNSASNFFYLVITNQYTFTIITVSSVLKKKKMEINKS